MYKQPRRTTGPLTDRQKEILAALGQGDRQKVIAHRYNASPAYIHGEVALILAKMDMRSTTAAVARYGSYLSYLKAAEVIRKRKTANPVGAIDNHVNLVLDQLVGQMTESAQKLLPS